MQLHPQPHYPSIPLLDVQEDYGEDEGDEGDRHRVELALLGFNCQAANRPLIPYDQPMVLRGNIGIGRYWFWCYFSMLAISLRPGITRNPEHLLPETSLGLEYLKQGKYISGDERGGFHVAKVNLPLPDPRLRIFIEGREDWLEEGLLVPAKKNKRGRIVEEGFSSAQAGGAQPNYVPPFGGIPTPPSYYGGSQMQAWGGCCTGAPTKLCGTQRNLRGALRKISPTTTKHGHNWRLCCEKHAKRCNHPIQRGSTW
jgi:hypothetical protein